MSLADQSLVRAEDVDGATRFRMLDTIREFAAERLTESGERTVIERRHAATFVALAESLTPRLSGTEQRVWLGRLERDHDNIRAVLDRSTAAGDASTAIRLASRCGATGRSAATWPRPGGASRRWPDAPWSREDPVLPGPAHGSAGRESPGGRPISRRWRPAYDEALALWESIGDPKEIANALYNDSFKYAVSDDPGKADPDRSGYVQMSRAQELAAAAGDERGRANALGGSATTSTSTTRTTRGSGSSREASTLPAHRRQDDGSVVAAHDEHRPA
jgi:hypothetical protein